VRTLTTKTIEDTRYSLVFRDITARAYLLKAEHLNRQAENLNKRAVDTYNDHMAEVSKAIAERDECRRKAARVLNGSAEEDDA
jgi:hypothetical protein